ncbi:MAG: pentapeptide repeat-containing protein [Candidatus Binataceae bacterium]
MRRRFPVAITPPRMIHGCSATSARWKRWNAWAGSFPATQLSRDRRPCSRRVGGFFFARRRWLRAPWIAARMALTAAVSRLWNASAFSRVLCYGDPAVASVRSSASPGMDLPTLITAGAVAKRLALLSCLLVAAVAVPVAVELVPLAGRNAEQPRSIRPALFARFVAPPAATSASRFELIPTAAGGRLIPVFRLPPRALCRNAHWQGADLSQQGFASADCTNAQFQGARLNGCNFRGANLSGAQMQEATMWFVDLDSARLTKANLRHADLARASLRQASLEGADLEHAILKAANLTQANLLGANMRGANLTAANLQDAILTGLVMDGVDFTRANLAGADLSRADLRNARGLTAAQLKLANTDSGTRMPEGMPAGVDQPSPPLQ